MKYLGQFWGVSENRKASSGLCLPAPSGYRRSGNMLKMDVRNVFLPHVKVAAIGSGTAKELEQFGVFADVMPRTFCAAALGEAIAGEAAPKSRIVLLRAKQGSEELLPPLKNAGLKVEDVPLYETVCKLQETLKETIEKQQRQGEIDLVTFTSASTVRGFVQALPGIDTTKIRAVCIGEQTANEAKRYGMQIQISEEASVESMVLKILELAEQRLGLTLSVSLHCPNDAGRSAIMPINRSYPIDVLLDACQTYFEKTGRRVTFEYAVMDQVNSAEQDAAALAERLKGLHAHVNLIPINPVKERNFHTLKKTVLQFQKTLERYGIPATIRRTLGSDIEAACGQLRRDAIQQT